MADLFPSSAFDNISLYDQVVIVGKDEHKGLIGLVVAIKNSEIAKEPSYIIELQATGDQIQRQAGNLKRYFKDK